MGVIIDLICGVIVDRRPAFLVLLTMEIESEQQTPIFQAQRSLSISAESMDYPVGRDALPPVKIFYHPSMEKLARKIVNLVEQTRLTAKEVSCTIIIYGHWTTITNGRS